MFVPLALLKMGGGIYMGCKCFSGETKVLVGENKFEKLKDLKEG